MEYKVLRTIIAEILYDWVINDSLELIEPDEYGHPAKRRYTLKEVLDKAGGAQELLPRLEALEKILHLVKEAPGIDPQKDKEDRLSKLLEGLSQSLAPSPLLHYEDNERKRRRRRA